jgi:hypothetical protein
MGGLTGEQGEQEQRPSKDREQGSTGQQASH